MSASITLTTQKRFACAIALVGALTLGGCGASSADQSDAQTSGGADEIGPKWEVTFRTAMEYTLTVSVMEK